MITRRLAQILLFVLLAALWVGCDDTNATEETGADSASMDTRAQDTASGDTRAQDTTPEDTSAPQDTASMDVEVSPAACPPDGLTPQPETACAETQEGLTCGMCSEDVCTFCNLATCDGSVWQRLEAFPHPFCSLDECEPLDPMCGVDEGCYWSNDTRRFHCMSAGADIAETPCEPSTPNSCEAGLICVRNPELGDAPHCQPVCRPTIDDGICGGPCDAMSTQGYSDVDDAPIEDVGFCYFQGG